MNISKRERYIIIFTALAVIILLGDKALVSPFLERRDNEAASLESLTTKVDSSQRLLLREQTIHESWSQMQAQGLGDSAPTAENRLIQAFQKWSDDAGLKNVTTVPARPRLRTALQQVTLQVTAAGPLNAITKFLWNVESAPIPVRVQQLTLNTRKEGADDLTLSVTLSTIYQPAPSPTPEANLGEKVVKYEE